MVQIEENWSEVTGSVVGIVPGGGAKADRSILRLKLERIRAMPGLPSLVEASKGSELRIHARPAQLDADVKPGTVVTMRVRRAGPADLWAHPDWRLSHPSSKG